MTARRYRKPGRPPGRTGRAGTRPRKAGHGDRRRRTLTGCLVLLTSGLLVACGAGLVAVGAGLGSTRGPEPRPVRPATTAEVQLHDLHQRLELTRVCAGQPADEWPCATVSP